MMRKIILFAMLILIAPTVLAADVLYYDESLFADANIITIRMKEVGNAAAKLYDGSVDSVTSTKAKLKGELAIDNYTMISEDISVTQSTRYVKVRNFKTRKYEKKPVKFMRFSIRNGRIDKDGFRVKCVENCLLTLSVVDPDITEPSILDALNKLLEPRLDIKGEANISKIGDDKFRAIIVKDITDAELEKSIKGFTIRGIPNEETSLFNDVLLQSDKPVYFSSIQAGAELDNVMLSGKAVLRSIPYSASFYIGNEPEETLTVVQEKPLLKVMRGRFEITNDYPSYSACAKSNLKVKEGVYNGCMLVADNNIKIQAIGTKTTKMNTVVYPDTGYTLTIDRTAKNDPSRTYITMSDPEDELWSIKTLRFKYDAMKEIPKNVDIFKFKTDFIFNFFSKDDELYHELRCLWRQKQCYIDGDSVRSGFLELSECSDDDDCKEGEFCGEKDLCLPAASCKRHENSPPHPKASMVFIGDGYPPTAEGERQLKQDIYDLTFDGLYTIEPFEIAENKLELLYMLPGTFPAGKDNRPLSELAIEYKDKCSAQLDKDIRFAVVVSKTKVYRAMAQYINPFLFSFDAKGGITFLPVSPAISFKDKYLFAHESGHMIARLADEYMNIDPTESYNDYYPGYDKPNCAPDSDTAEDWLDDLKLGAKDYSSMQFKSCGGDCPPSEDFPDGKGCETYIRPSENSIMNDQTKSFEFNKPSRYAIRKALYDL